MQRKQQNIILVIILALLYYFAAEMRSQLITYAQIVSTIVFPSEGIALAFALYFGKRVWPGIFIGQFFVAYFNGLDIPTSLAISSINATESVIAVILFNRFKLNNTLESFRDIIGLSLLILLILQPFSAISSNLILLTSHHITSEQFFDSSFSWWFGNIMGQFLFTPLLLALFYNYKKINLQEFVIYTLSFATYILILLYFLHIKSSLLLLSMTLPILLYITYRHTTVFALTLIVLMSYIISFFISHKAGPFLYQDGSVNVVDYNLYFLTLILTTLTAKILFENQQKQKKQLQIIIQQEIEKNKEQQLFMLQQNRLAQMGEMITMIAHQWKEPLNNLSLLHQLLLTKHQKKELDEKMINYFKKSADMHISLMSETINDFKNFLKPQEQEQEFDINELIYTLLNITKPALNKHDIKIIFFTKSSYTCKGYKNSLGHAIINIINNAKDILVENEIENKKIEIKLIEKERNLIISIRDNAGGINEDILEKIFDPYFSTKNKKDGTGLGLYMAKMIITEHINADIEVRNSPTGAIFDIVLKNNLCKKNS